MSVLISFLLVVIAALLFLQKPLKIEINHTYPEATLETPVTQTTKEVEDQPPAVSLDQLIKNMSEIMGVSNEPNRE